MAPGDGNEVLVRFNGDGQKLQGTIQDMIKALQQFGKALDDTSKKAGDSAPGGGKNSLDQYRFSLDSLTESALKSMGGFGGFMVAMNSTIGVVTEIASVIGGAVSGFLSLAETVGGVVIDALRQAGEEVANLTEQVFELNKSTEQNTGSWKFIYGMGQSQDLMKWTSGFSMKVPYTRQDLMGAITALGRAGLSEQQVKDYMSVIADMGALNPQRNLTQAAWSIQGAMHGYSRMLKYDYGINPEELYQFGYDENNPEQTLLPALQAYLSARHMLGAAKYAATETFWGAESSFVDRLQNFGLMVGGTDLSGNVSKGSMFGVLKDDLKGLSQWWDDHSKQIGQIADFFQNILGGAFKTATSFMQGFMDGLQKSGFETFMEHTLKSLGDLLNSKDLQSGANSVGALAGKGIGTLLTDIGLGLYGLYTGLKQSGAGQSLFEGLKNIVNWLGDPKHQQDIATAGYLLGTVLGGAIVKLGDAANYAHQHIDATDWQTLGIILAGIGVVFAAGLIAGFAALLGILLLVAAPVIAAYLAIKLFIDGVKSLGDALKGIHWPTFSPTAPGDQGPPPVPGGTGPTTQGGPGGGVVLSSNSNAQFHFYGANIAQVAGITQRMLDERDRGSYLARRTPGGFSSLGILG